MPQLGNNTESYDTASTTLFSSEKLKFWQVVEFRCTAEIWSFTQQAGDAAGVSRHGV